MTTPVTSQVPSLRLSTVLAMAERLPSLVGAHEIAELLNVSRQRVQQLAALPDFPAPAAKLQVGRIWTKGEVIAWARRTGRIVEDDTD